MENTEIELPPGADLVAVEQAIDAVISAAGLEIALRGSLRKFPGCTHWHARLHGQSGTLEITLWPQQHRAWLTVQSGRRAGWIAGKLAEFRQRLQSAAGEKKQKIHRHGD